jgi:hypothetical protein
MRPQSTSTPAHGAMRRVASGLHSTERHAASGTPADVSRASWVPARRHSAPNAMARASGGCWGGRGEAGQDRLLHAASGLRGLTARKAAMQRVLAARAGGAAGAPAAQAQGPALVPEYGVAWMHPSPPRPTAAQRRALAQAKGNEAAAAATSAQRRIR